MLRPIRAAASMPGPTRSSSEALRCVPLWQSARCLRSGKRAQGQRGTLADARTGASFPYIIEVCAPVYKQPQYDASMKCSPCCGRCAASCKHVVNISGSAMQPRNGVLAASCVEVHQRPTTISKICACINDHGHQANQHGIAIFVVPPMYLPGSGECRNLQALSALQ